MSALSANALIDGESALPEVAQCPLISDHPTDANRNRARFAKASVFERSSAEQTIGSGTLDLPYKSIRR
jgi:hypothetical protein